MSLFDKLDELNKADKFYCIPETFVNPETRQGSFTVVIVLIGTKQALEYLSTIEFHEQTHTFHPRVILGNCVKVIYNSI